MIDLTLDMRQYDCPFIDTTDDYAVAFTASDWEFDPVAGELETRMTVEGNDSGALSDGLGALRDHDHLHECRLRTKSGATAEIVTTIHETEAMATIRDHGGFITGPFHIEEGTEQWHVGVENPVAAEETLAALERDNEFTVESRERVDGAAIGGVVQNAGAAMALIEGCQALTDVERRTLQTAVQEGYFETPREITLGELADEFDVSKPAVSKNLRRGERKLLERAVEAIGDLDTFP